MYRWDPFGDIWSVRDAMDRWMRESMPARGGGRQSPPLEVSEDPDQYCIRLSLPGVKPEDVHIEMNQNVLTVNGEFRQPEAPSSRRYLHQEHSFGTFSRSISLPGQVSADKANATFEHGILTITLPKAEEARPRRIPIGSGASSQRTIESGATGGSMIQRSSQQGGEQSAGQSSEERTRVQQTSGFQSDNKEVPVKGEKAEQHGGTEAAVPQPTAEPEGGPRS